MTISLTKHQKCGAGLLAGLAVLVLWCWPEGEEQLEMQPVAAEAGSQESGAKPKLVQQEPAALAEIPLSELRNPFSLHHEKRAASQSVPGKPSVRPDASPERASVPQGAGESAASRPEGAAAASQQRTPAEASSAVHLRGILYGDSGRFVILAAGSKSASLAEGESFAGWQVQRIERQGVLLLGPQGEQYLRLLHSDRHSD